MGLKETRVMYGVNEEMGRQSTHEPIDSTATQSATLSPELREVLHMLDVIEQNVKVRNSGR